MFGLLAVLVVGVGAGDFFQQDFRIRHMFTEVAGYFLNGHDVFADNLFRAFRNLLALEFILGNVLNDRADRLSLVDGEFFPRRPD